jgi:6-phosphogluconolactonase
MPRINVFPDIEHLSLAAAGRFVELADGAVAARGRFTLALAGGATPRVLYSLLAGGPFSGQVDWPRAYVFWGDERCVPPEDPRSNYRLAHETLLSRVPVDPAHVFRIRGEAEPTAAAAEYERYLRQCFGPQPGQPGPPASGFDLVLLGMGDDGHTASLFPGTPPVEERERWAMPNWSSETSTWRVTLTPPVLNAARQVMFLVSGSSKAERLAEVLEGPRDPLRLPAQIVQPARGEVAWYVDQGAAARLECRGAEGSAP